MYAIKDFHGTRGHASSVESYSPDALRFMALIQPWIRAGGSALDVEEAMFQLDLPTDYRGWSKLSPNEIDLALAVGRMFSALTRTAFTVAGADEVTHLVPAIGPYVSGPNSLNAPLQFAINIQDGGARDATAIAFTLAPAAYLALSAAGVQQIDAVNASIRTVGALGTGEDAIEVGERRVVVRKEVAEKLLSSALLSSAHRNSIPWLAGIEVNVYGMEAEVTVNAGAVTEDMVLYHRTDSSRSITVSRFLAGVPDKIRVKSVTGTSPIVTDVYINGDLSVTVTIDTILVQVSLLAGNLPIKNGDPNDISTSSNGSPYPFISPVVTDTIQADTRAVSYMFARGVADASTPGGATTGLKPAIREDSRRRLEAGMCMLAAFYDLVSRGTITGAQATLTAVKTALKARQLYPTAQDAMSGAQRVTFTYSAGNATAPAVEDIASFGNTRGTVVRVVGNGVSGVMDVVMFLGDVEPSAGGVLTTDTGSSQTVVAADVVHGLPAFIGDPATLSHAGDMGGLTPIGEYGIELAYLSSYHILLQGGGGGGLIATGESFQIPSAQNFTNNKRHMFQAGAQAWLEKIDIDFAADPLQFANAASALQTLGWPTWVAGTALVRAEALLAVDPSLWRRYMTDLAIVASGENVSPVFRVRASVAGKTLGQGLALDGGQIGLVPVSPVDGETEARFTVQFRVPDIGSNLGKGSIMVEFPEGVAAFIHAAYLPTVPATTAIIAGVGTRVLTLTFDDAAGAGYAPGTLVSLAEVTIRAGVRYAGDPGRGTAFKVSRFGGWSNMGGTVDLTGRFFGARMVVLTELP